MLRWRNGLERAWFKPMPAGYLFQLPHPLMPLVSPRGYLISAAQKVALEACVRRYLVCGLLAMTAFGIGLSLISVKLLSLIVLSIDKPGLSILEGVGIIFVAGLLALPFFILLDIWFIRAMRLQLADAPRTQERFGTGEKSRILVATICGY
jgi:hypothetical protein